MSRFTAQAQRLCATPASNEHQPLQWFQLELADAVTSDDKPGPGELEHSVQTAPAQPEAQQKSTGDPKVYGQQGIVDGRQRTPRGDGSRRTGQVSPVRLLPRTGRSALTSGSGWKSRKSRKGQCRLNRLIKLKSFYNGEEEAFLFPAKPVSIHPTPSASSTSSALPRPSVSCRPPSRWLSRTKGAVVAVLAGRVVHPVVQAALTSLGRRTSSLRRMLVLCCRGLCV